MIEGSIFIEDVVGPLEGDRLERAGARIAGDCRCQGFEIQEVDRVFHILQFFLKLRGKMLAIVDCTASYPFLNLRQGEEFGDIPDVPDVDGGQLI